MSTASAESDRRKLGGPPYLTGGRRLDLVFPGVHATLCADGDNDDPYHIRQTQGYLQTVYDLHPLTSGDAVLSERFIADTLGMLNQEGLVAEHVRFDLSDPLAAFVDNLRESEDRDELYLVGLHQNNELQMVTVKSIRFSQTTDEYPANVAQIEVLNIHTGKFQQFSAESFLEAWGQGADDNRFICFRVSYPHKKGVGEYVDSHME